MQIILSGLNFIFDVILYPFLLTGKIAGLLLISVAAGIGLLILFKRVSNQEIILKRKNLIAAHILEFRLYQDDLKLIMTALGQALWQNVLYLKAVLKPLLVFIIPVLLLIVQLSKTYAFRPFEAEADILISTIVHPDVDMQQIALKGENLTGLPVRLPDENRIVWRIQTDQNGEVPLSFVYENQKESLKIHIRDDANKKILPFYLSARSIKSLLYPADRLLTSDSFIKEIEIYYPPGIYSIFGFHIHWLLFFFIISVITGFASKKKLGVAL